MSFSLFRNFMDCEAKALHDLRNPKENNDRPLILGNYVHSYFESPKAHDQFMKDKHKYIFKSQKARYADFDKADGWIKRLSAYKLFKKLYVGKKEAMVTGQMYDVDWKGKIDCLNLEQGYFIDLKTVKNFKDEWNSALHQRVNFVIKRLYTMQIAIYKYLLEEKYDIKFTPLIFAVTKESVPDVACISFDDYNFNDDYKTIQSYLPHVMRVIYGLEEPTACGKCDYCKTVKQPGIVDVTEFGY